MVPTFVKNAEYLHKNPTPHSKRNALFLLFLLYISGIHVLQQTQNVCVLHFVFVFCFVFKEFYSMIFCLNEFNSMIFSLREAIYMRWPGLSYLDNLTVFCFLFVSVSEATGSMWIRHCWKSDCE